MPTASPRPRITHAPQTSRWTSQRPAPAPYGVPSDSS